jgi:uncharacterized protein (DUF1697 family)
MPRYVALLRGINVGGKNLIKMADLKACLEDHGLEDVATYIQSGNVVFASAETATAGLTQGIEAMLAETFGYEATVVVRNRRQMRAVVERAPKGFGAEQERYRYDVIFLKEPLAAKDALKSVPTKPGVDETHAGTGVLYFSRLIEKATQSQLSKIISSPIYPSVTIRNWNTTTKIVRMMDDTHARRPERRA